MSSSPETVQPDRPRATAVGALIEGWRRAAHAPGLVLGVWLVTALAAVPLAAVFAWTPGAVSADRLTVDGLLLTPAGVLEPGAPDLSTTLSRELLGTAGFVATLSRVFTGGPTSLALVGAVAVYLALSAFLAGGVIDRLARARPLGAATFVALSGAYFGRLIRLTVVAGLAYWVLFALVYPLLFTLALVPLAGQPPPNSLVVGLSTFFLLLLAALTLLFDFTRVRLVVEDRRSVLAALGAAQRFVRRRLWRVAGLYALNVVVLLVLGRFWQELTAGGVSGWSALFFSQIYLLSRVWARVALLGSEAVFFQGELGHAHYAAAPLPRWPDSASVEAVRNLRRD